LMLFISFILDDCYFTRCFVCITCFVSCFFHLLVLILLVRCWAICWCHSLICRQTLNTRMLSTYCKSVILLGVNLSESERFFYIIFFWFLFAAACLPFSLILTLSNYKYIDSLLEKRDYQNINL
jgi:hypothetical protein